MENKSYIRIVPGSDTAVLLVHGIVGTPRQFRDLLPVLPQSWSVYNILLDGHGHGVEEFGRTSMKKWKAQVSTQLDEILRDHKRVLMIGHSMGTLFSIQEAIDRPNEIPALFLLQSPLRVHLPPRTMCQCLLTVFGKNDPASAELRDACGLRLTKKLWKYIPWIPRFWELLCESKRIRELIGTLKTPCVCFQSAKDELVSMRSSKELAKNSGIHVHVLQESGHFFYSKRDTQLLQRELKRIIEMYFYIEIQ